MDLPIPDQPTQAQRWVYAVSGLLTILNSGDPQYFGGGIPIKHSIWAQEKLRTEGINTLNDLYRNFNQTLGHVPKPLVMSKGLTDDNEVVIAFKAEALYPPDENDLTWWQYNYSLGWKLMRTTYLAGLAQIACMITREEAWDIACLTAQIFQFIFSGWDDVFIAAKKSMSIGDQAAETCQQQLKEINGLWTLPWNQNIQQVPCPTDNRRTFYVSANREQNQYQNQKSIALEDALLQARDGDRLELAAGIYTGPWRITTSLEIVAQGQVIIQASESAPASLIIADAFVRLYNIQIMSPLGEDRGQVAIACISGALLLEHCSVSSTGHGISIAKPAKAILFRSLIDSCKLNGVVVEGRLEVNQSTFSNIQYHSIHVNNHAYAELSHCLFKNSGSHMVSLENGSIARINDSQFENSAQAALVITQDSSLDLIRGKMTNAGLIALNAKRCMILDTEFDSPPLYHEAQQQIAVFSQVKENIIVNCTFHKAGQHAIHIDQANYLRIENSSFKSINACALVLSNCTATAESSIKNSVLATDQGEMAVMINNSNITLTTCSIEGGIECSLLITEKAVTSLRSCQFKQSPKVALLIRNHAQCFSNNCQFSGSGLSAIDVFDGLGQFTLCEFLKMNAYGIRIQGQSNVVMDQCRLDKVVNQAIHVNGLSIVTANQLQITRANPEVIFLENGAYFNLDSATFDESKQITITLTNATLAHKNCEAITKKSIRIKNENSTCLSLN